MYLLPFPTLASERKRGERDREKYLSNELKDDKKKNENRGEEESLLFFFIFRFFF